jgi:flagellar hook-length control protein FliK
VSTPESSQETTTQLPAAASTTLAAASETAASETAASAPVVQAPQAPPDATTGARAATSAAALASALTASQGQAGSQSQPGGEGAGGGQAGSSGSAAAQATSAVSSSSHTNSAVVAATQTSVASLLQASVATAAGEANPLTGLAAAIGLQASGEGIAASGASAAAPSAGPVGMQDMINAIHATIEIAARQGATQARIQLQPQDLGQINIRLSQTSQGLLARVSAETPAAAQALADGRSELRQSLSSLGLPLLRLDISAYGQSAAREHQERFAGDTRSASTSSTSPSLEDSEGVEPLGELEAASAPAALTGGALVDVLA